VRFFAFKIFFKSIQEILYRGVYRKITGSAFSGPGLL